MYAEQRYEYERRFEPFTIVVASGTIRLESGWREHFQEQNSSDVDEKYEVELEKRNGIARIIA